MDFSSLGFTLCHAHRIPIAARRCHLSVPRLAGVSNRWRLESLLLVRHVLRIRRQPLRHPAAPHVQRKTLLVPRASLWRHPLRPVCQPQSFRGLRGVGHSACARSSRARQDPARTPSARRCLFGRADRSAPPLRFPRRHHQPELPGGPAIALADRKARALSLVYWLGAGQILQRFSAMHSLEITAGKRASMRRDTFRIFLDHPVVGTGLGTLQIVFPRYETNYDGRVVNHAHNDYLEALAETGFLGAVSCAWFLFALFRGYLRRSRDSASASFPAALNFAGILSCAGFLIHSLVDFNLHIPANAALFFLMATLATAEILPNAPSAPTAAPHRAQLVPARIP